MNINYGECLKKFREKNNLTGEQLGRLIGVGKSAISNYENHTRKVPLDYVVKLAVYFQVSIDSIIGIKSNENIIDISSFDKETKDLIVKIVERLNR